MTAWTELLEVFSRPRPNGSEQERGTADWIAGRLHRRGLRVVEQAFVRQPYLWEWLGLWLIVSGPTVWILVWAGKASAAGLAAGILVLVATADVVAGRPVLFRPGCDQGRNLLVPIGPPRPGSRLFLTAHYDSKTELLDHRARLVLIRALVPTIVASAALAAAAPVWLVSPAAAWWLSWLRWLSLVLATGIASVCLVLGTNLLIGRWLRPSQGAVDNGAACAVLLQLADAMADDAELAGAPPRSAGSPEAPADLRPDQGAAVCLVWLAAEEVNMQGSRALVRDGRVGPDDAVLNLELLGQNGPWVVWDEDGSVFERVSVPPRVNARVARIVSDVTGAGPESVGPLSSDGGSFLMAGIPATTLGTYDRVLGDRGLHRPTDRRARVHDHRLDEAVSILRAVVRAHLESPSGIFAASPGSPAGG